MAKVDTSKWKEYYIGGENGLFDVVKGKRLTKVDMIDGEINFIGSSAGNNGVTNQIGNMSNIHEGNLITVSYNGSVGEAFYQEERFVASDDVNVLYPKFKLNKYIAWFLCPIIRSVGKKYAFIDKWKKEEMERSIIKLPVDTKGNPDWNYMEDYAQNIESVSKSTLAELKDIINEPLNKIDLTSFKRFHLYDDGLFIIDSGTKLDRVRMTNSHPEINFVGRANANNGVTDFIDKIEGLEPYDAGNMTISLGGEYLGSCFIQDKSFYTSQNVNVLIPQRDMSYYCKQYIATMVFREGRLHYKAFIDELNRHMKTDFTIPLPVNNGNIDWNYMERYMQNIERIAQGKIDSL